VNEKRYALGLIAVLAVLALTIAGCGGSDSTSGGGYGGSGGGTSTTDTQGTASESSGRYGSGGGKPTSAGETNSGDGIVSAAQVGDLGAVLVDSQGLTLYDFHKDKGGESSCYGACAAAWPPLLTGGDPQAQGPADRSMLGTTKRKDGSVQVTYNGWPLYTYAGDKAPGEATGNDIDQFGAEWYALQPNGQEPED
jgi:predicted lipoprotein with Yx(FWY)xxD motif